MKSKTRLKLDIEKGPAQGTSFLLSELSTLIGRGEPSAIRILDAAMSKVHFRVDVTDRGTFLTDLGSRNGTVLNGVRVAANRPYELPGRSVIQAGNSTLRFLEERADEEALEPLAETTQQIEIIDLPKKAVRKNAAPRVETIPFFIGSNRNLAAIYRILNSIGAVTDRQVILKQALELVVSTLAAERGLVFLAEELAPGHDPKPAAEKTRKPGDRFSAAGLSRGAMDRALEEGTSILASEILRDERRTGASGSGRSTPRAEVRSILVSPIKTKERIFGLLYLDRSVAEGSFKREDVELLTSLGIYLGSILENAKLHGELRELFIGVIKTLVRIIEAKDAYTQGHSERVAQISLAIGQHLGLSHEEQETLRLAALIHDIGKVAVPEEILNKPTWLTEQEIEIIKRHPEVGAGFISHLEAFEKISQGIRSHHERFDGQGYPDGLAGDKIPLIARIIAVADTFDAMTSDRAYRKRFSDREALEEIARNRGTQFDPDVADLFVKLQRPCRPARGRGR